MPRGELPGRPWKRLAVSALAGAMLFASFSGIGNAAPSSDDDASVITSWNATVVATIAIDAGKANAEGLLWFGFVQAAVYNAVVGITREYELYAWNRRGPRGASPEAAAAAAAHRILMYYFPASQVRLDTALEASLAGVTDGSAEQQGVAFGERAADHIIALRADDGRFAPITFDVLPAPGVWRPTPPGFAPFFDPWLGQVEPMLVQSPSQFLAAPPPALTSTKYATDFEEVKVMGAKFGSPRTALETETALFFSDTGVGPLQGSLRDLATRHAMDISDSARLFAAVDMGLADSVITIWNGKYVYGYWRPITAIHLADTDDNPATIQDPTWEPLIVNPPYPEYPSGLTSVVGVVSRTVSRILGGGRVDLYITSAAAGAPGPPATRYYEFASELNQDAINARIWSGIHFRTADVVGNATGAAIADWGLDHYFQPQ